MLPAVVVVVLLAQHVAHSQASTTPTFRVVGDPRSKRVVGTQAEVATLAISEDGMKLAVNGYQRFDLYAGRVDRPIVHLNHAKYSYLRGLLSRLLQQEHCWTLIDIGCSAGLASLLGIGVGFQRVTSLDHDPEYIAVLRHAVAWANLTSNIEPKVFRFGEPLPAPTDVVLCGALIHWVYCRTADFENSFERILDYLHTAVNPGKYLIVEWVDPQDSSVRSEDPSWWPARCFRNSPDGSRVSNYSRTNFEKAVSRRFEVVERKSPHKATRVFYVLRKLAAGLVAPARVDLLRPRNQRKVGDDRPQQQHRTRAPRDANSSSTRPRARRDCSAICQRKCNPQLDADVALTALAHSTDRGTTAATLAADGWKLLARGTCALLFANQDRQRVLKVVGLPTKASTPQTFDLTREAAVLRKLTDDSCSKGSGHCKSARIAHGYRFPRLLRSYSGSYERERHAYFMETDLCGTRNFASALRSCASSRCVTRVVTGLLNALEELSTLGIKHRDIDESNVLLDQNGVVCLVDFGAATFADQPVDVHATWTTLGRLRPPEHAGCSSHDDLYSVGMILKCGAISAMNFPSAHLRGVLLGLGVRMTRSVCTEREHDFARLREMLYARLDSSSELVPSAHPPIPAGHECGGSELDQIRRSNHSHSWVLPTQSPPRARKKPRHPVREKAK